MPALAMPRIRSISASLGACRRDAAAITGCNGRKPRPCPELQARAGLEGLPVLALRWVTGVSGPPGISGEEFIPDVKQPLDLPVGRVGVGHGRRVDRRHGRGGNAHAAAERREHRRVVVTLPLNVALAQVARHGQPPPVAPAAVLRRRPRGALPGGVGQPGPVTLDLPVRQIAEGRGRRQCRRLAFNGLDRPAEDGLGIGAQVPDKLIPGQDSDLIPHVGGDGTVRSLRRDLIHLIPGVKGVEHHEELLLPHRASTGGLRHDAAPDAIAADRQVPPGGGNPEPQLGAFRHPGRPRRCREKTKPAVNRQPLVSGICLSGQVKHRAPPGYGQAVAGPFRRGRQPPGAQEQDGQGEHPASPSDPHGASSGPSGATVRAAQGGRPFAARSPWPGLPGILALLEPVGLGHPYFCFCSGLNACPDMPSRCRPWKSLLSKPGPRCQRLRPKPG